MNMVLCQACLRAVRLNEVQLSGRPGVGVISPLDEVPRALCRTSSFAAA